MRVFPSIVPTFFSKGRIKKTNKSNFFKLLLPAWKGLQQQLEGFRGTQCFTYKETKETESVLSVFSGLSVSL